MVSRVEWARRFGENNELLYKGLIDGVKEANAKGGDIEGFRVERALRIAEAMQGVYKMGGHRGWVKLQRGYTAFLNAALASAKVEPLSIPKESAAPEIFLLTRSMFGKLGRGSANGNSGTACATFCTLPTAF